MKVCWLDLETSGLDPARHGIISLAYQVEIDGHTAASGSLFSNCRGKEIELSALTWAAQQAQRATSVRVTCATPGRNRRRHKDEGLESERDGVAR